jgi:hypothetical protein
MTNSYDPNIRPSLQRLGSEIKFHKKLVDNGVVPSCISCAHWGTNTTQVDGNLLPREEVCRLYSMRPPAEVIVLGCASWEWDFPF